MFLKKEHLFIRNIDAGEYLESFLVAAVASILVIRLYLKLANYPQIGGETLHIAHMLWGGLLMLVAIIILLSFLSRASLRWAAVIGGIGFGTFIDEMGKFVTQDNDYFYQPAVALMYVVFILIIVSIRAIHRGRSYSEEEYLMNALHEMEEVALHDLDEGERNRALSYLEKSNPDAPLVKSLQNLLTMTQIVPVPNPSRLSRLRQNSRNLYYKLTEFPVFPIAVVLFFLGQLVVKIGYAFVLIFFKGLGIEQIGEFRIFYFLAERTDNLSFIEWAEFASSLLSGVFVLLGVLYIYRSRLIALKMFERSILVSIFLTQVFMFYNEQFLALLGLSFNLLILMALRFMIHREISRGSD